MVAVLNCVDNDVGIYILPVVLNFVPLNALLFESVGTELTFKYKAAKLEHPLNAYAWMFFIADKTTLESLLQLVKAYEPITVAWGKVIELKRQLKNAELPIYVTLPNVASYRKEHALKALEPIEITDGKYTLCKLLQK